MHDEREERAMSISFLNVSRSSLPAMFVHLIKLRNTIWARVLEGGPRHPQNGNLLREARKSSEWFLNLKHRGNASTTGEGPSSISGVGLGSKSINGYKFHFMYHAGFCNCSLSVPPTHAASWDRPNLLDHCSCKSHD